MKKKPPHKKGRYKGLRVTMDPKKPDATKDYLERMTGHDTLYWLRRVQALIADHSTAATGPLHNRHGRTDVGAWVVALHREVLKTHPRGKEIRYDGNMRHAAVFSLILQAWFLRVQRAKCHDPRRPVDTRRLGMAKWSEYAQEVTRIVTDDTLDALFNEQHWDPPFSQHAISGVFT